MSERELLITLVTDPAGYSVTLFETLSVDRMCDGSYRLLYQPDMVLDLADGNEETYGSAEEAVDRFLAIRHKINLGYDYEKLP